MEQSPNLPPPVPTSYQLVDGPVQTPVQEPVQRIPTKESIPKPVQVEPVQRIPTKEYFAKPIQEEPARPMPTEEPVLRVPFQESALQMPVAEPAPAATKDEQPLQRKDKEIMQHPSGSEGWLPTEEPAAPQMPEPRRHAPTRATSTSSARIKDNDNLDATIAANAEAEAAGTAPRRATSLGSRKSVPTVTERPPVPGPAFMGGAGVTGPKAAAEEDVAMTTRNQEARDNLTVRQRSRIAKDEAKHDKRLSKIIIEEGKTEKEALAIALDDLDNVQKLQKKTVKNEGRLLDSVARLQLTLKRAEADFLDAKTRCDMAQAAVNAELDNLETLRNQSRRLTEELQRKTADINTLRSTLAVDEREREVKLAQLRGAAGAAPSFWT